MSLGHLLSGVFDRVFVLRLAIGFVAGGLGATGISFAVSDYVSKAAVDGFNATAHVLHGDVLALGSEVGRVSTDLVSESRKFREAQGDLSGDLKALMVEMRSTNDALRGLTGSLDTLNGTVRDVQAKMVEIDTRQRIFERFVTQRLIAAAPPEKPNPTWYQVWGIEAPPKGFDVSFPYPSADEVKGLWATYSVKGKN